MTVEERLTRCRLIEKIEKNEAYAKRLGISNDSTFRGNHKIDYKEKKRGW